MDLNDIRLMNAEDKSLSRVLNSPYAQNNQSKQYPKPSFPLKIIKAMAAFSLIELMVTLGVFAIALTIAIPSFRTMLMNSRISANTDSFVNALNYARNSALTLSVNVQVCPIGAPNSVTCGANWNSGWIVATVPTTGVGTLLQSQEAGPNDPQVSGSAAAVTFDPQGLATTQSNFAVCDTRGSNYARSIQVLPTGNVQAGQTTGVAVWNNGAITCP